MRSERERVFSSEVGTFLGQINHLAPTPTVLNQHGLFPKSRTSARAHRRDYMAVIFMLSASIVSRTIY